MFAVAGIDPFGTVAAEEIPVEFQSAAAFQHGHAFLLGAAGINGAFVDHQGAGLHDLADGLAGPVKRGQVGMFVPIHRSRDRDNENIAIAQVFRIGRIFEFYCGGKFGGGSFQRGILAAAQGIETGLFDIEPDRIEMFAEFDRQRQSHISQSDQSDFRAPVRNFTL